ncbi:MAG TPA: cytochrome o ubiquinol oxidase subunit III [Spirochaetia bacterium]|nr:cytochrome o ubiquinol oxidase subunit III [Spirochaetia bacterium]
MSNTATNTAVSHEAHEDHAAGNKLFGFWIYLMSDLIIFAVLFATFAVIRGNLAGGPGPKDLFEVPYLFLETMFLLVSSVTYGLAMVSLQKGKATAVFVQLLVTFALGFGFIFMEVSEFRHLILEGFGPDRSGFLSGFFTLVGTHGLHVSFGLLWMIVLMVQVLTKGLTAGVKSRLARLSLFWHFLDIVWVGVFTFVYLIGLV